VPSCLRTGRPRLPAPRDLLLFDYTRSFFEALRSWCTFGGVENFLSRKKVGLGDSFFLVRLLITYMITGLLQYVHW